MRINILATAVALSDPDLLARIPVLAARERTATAELVAHLAALRLRPSLYAAQGYGSLFAYCREALRLSEDAASNRIHAARACLKFPAILVLLASGDLSLSAVRMLRPHLTMDNHERVLARARNGRRADILRLVAELAPRPDVASSVRRLPVPSTSVPEPAIGGQPLLRDLPAVVMASSSKPVMSESEPTPAAHACSTEDRVMRRPIIQPLSPERYRVQFTIGQEGYDILRRLQTLLRREIPDGDAGVIFDRALRLFHEKVEAAQFGTAEKRRLEKRRLPEHRPDVRPAYENRIRPGADPAHPDGRRSRYIPKAVKRAVWYRDRGQCAFVAVSGQRCVEQEFLELHHIHPYALRGSATVANIALRCRRHNAYEAELVFGARAASARPEGTSRAAP